MTLYYLLALNHIPGIGPRTIKKILEHYSNLEDFFKLSQVELLQIGFSARVSNAIATFNFDKVEKDLRWAEAKQHFIVTREDVTYPPLLKEIPDAPVLLYAQGDKEAFNQKSLAIVGTRHPSITGKETAKRIAFELASKNITIVSGLALGIDGEAHQGTLDAQGRTIAVLGTGVDIIYPRKHLKLAEKIVERGLLLSEFPLGTSPIARHFPQRNRIISGLSLGTLVVEAAIKSGSLITARFALEQNRDVLAIPNSIYNPQARGCHFLLQQGAKLITSSADILAELNIEVQQTPEVVTNSNNNTSLMQYIGFEVTSVDKITKRCGYSIDEVICDLVNLELQGDIKAVPGGYIRCTYER